MPVIDATVPVFASARPMLSSSWSSPGREAGDPLVDPRLGLGGEDEVEQREREREERHEREQHAVRDCGRELRASMPVEGGDGDERRRDEPPHPPDGAIDRDGGRRGVGVLHVVSGPGRLRTIGVALLMPVSVPDPRGSSGWATRR